MYTDSITTHQKSTTPVNLMLYCGQKPATGYSIKAELPVSRGRYNDSINTRLYKDAVTLFIQAGVIGACMGGMERVAMSPFQSHLSYKPWTISWPTRPYMPWQQSLDVKAISERLRARECTKITATPPITEAPTTWLSLGRPQA